MDDVLKALFAASPSTLLLLAGLLCLLLALIGALPGKVELPKALRPVAAILGAALVGGGLWLTIGPTFKVTSATLDTEQATYGDPNAPCPVTVAVDGLITVSGTGTVGYQMEFSDGQHAEVRTVLFKRNAMPIKEIWRVQSSIPSGFAVLNILSPPGATAVRTSRPIQVSCRDGRSLVEPAEGTTSASGAPAAAGAFDGSWEEIDSGARAPMRWTIKQSGNRLNGTPFAFVVQDDTTASVSGIQDCAARFQRPGFDYKANPSRYTLILKREGNALVYSIETYWNTPCDGHNIGKEETIHKFRRAPST